MPSSGSGADCRRLSGVAILPLCHEWPADRNPPALACSVMRRELGVDDHASRQLAPSGAAAAHARAWPHQAEIAAHEAARPLKVGEHLSAILGDGRHFRTPRSPAAPAPAPAPATPASAPA